MYRKAKPREDGPSETAFRDPPKAVSEVVRWGKFWEFVGDSLREVEWGGGWTYRGEGGRKPFSVGVLLVRFWPPLFFCPPPPPFGALWPSVSLNWRVLLTIEEASLIFLSFFLWISLFFSLQGISLLFERFSLLSQEFLRFGREKNPCFFWWFSLLFPKTQGKDIRVVHYNVKMHVSTYVDCKQNSLNCKQKEAQTLSAKASTILEKPMILLKGGGQNSFHRPIAMPTIPSFDLF